MQTAEKVSALLSVFLHFEGYFPCKYNPANARIKHLPVNKS